ncbi:MAG: hypothetical protein KGJ86_23060, partial [Chloroflexota bacterium]|nr:hypothetical protein [Chloroflexota bacterium]
MPQFTSRQRNQAEKLVGDVITSLNPGKDEFQQKVLDAKRAEIFQARIREVLVAMMARHFIPLTDEEALAWLVEQAKKSEPDAHQLIKGCRKGALEQGLANSVPCHFAVELGATLKQTIPTVGPCVEDFNYLQGWQFADVPTEHSLVSGVPVALRDTTNQNLGTQLKTLGAIEQRWGIPAGFFSTELIPTVYTAGVALAYHDLTQQQMFGDLWVRTGTCNSGGSRLDLSWR